MTSRLNRGFPSICYANPYQIMEGPAKLHRFVVIEFPTFERGVACFTSPECDRTAAFRRDGAGEAETIMVEGADPTR